MCARRCSHSSGCFALQTLTQTSALLSMQEQMRLLIEREVRYSQVGGVERARRWRSLLAGRHFPDLAADIQADRSR